MRTKRVVFVVVLVLVGSLLWMVSRQHASAKATYTDFIAQVEAGKVKNAVITQQRTGADPVTYTLHDGTMFETIVPSDYRELLEALRAHTVNVEIRGIDSQWSRSLVNSTPFLILLILWFVMLGRLRNSPFAG
jgi:ATP-dependent Zn protease